MNRNKSLSIVLVVVTLALSMTGVVSAQGPDRGEQLIGARALISALSDLTGLKAVELLDNAEPEVTTLTDIASANGLTAAQIVDAAEVALTDTISEAVANGRIDQQRADETLATLRTDLETLMTEPIPAALAQAPQIMERLHQIGERGLIGALVDATGLEPMELAQQALANEYTTLAELAEANGADPDAMIETAVAGAAEQINEAVANGTLGQVQANLLLERLPQTFANLMNHDISNIINAVNNRPAVDVARAVLQTVSESTGLDPQAILNRVREGESMADILTASGVNPDDVVTALIDDITPRLEEQIMNILNASRPFPAAG